ncbi:MAG: extradiol ring-cleavage dioxygenase, partial [Pseudomonadota bacterium]
SSYTDEETLRDAGQGGFEIRTFNAVAGAAGGQGEIWYMQPIPIFAVSCTVGVMEIV